MIMVDIEQPLDILFPFVRAITLVGDRYEMDFAVLVGEGKDFPVVVDLFLRDLVFDLVEH